MWSHEASVVIDAPASDVWRVLVDLDRYPQWNRYATSAVGNLRVGGNVTINVPRQGEKRGPVDNRVTEIETDRLLCWQSLSWYRFLVYGIRCRHLEPQSDGTTLFREAETMYGPLAGLIRKTMAPQLLRGIQTECDSLRDEVERLASESTGQ